MNEHPLLAQLAQLTGGFSAANNPSIEQLQTFHSEIANVLLQQQPVNQLQDSFKFETIQNLSTQKLDAKDLEYLNSVLETAETTQAPKLRAFRREVPIVSIQVMGSVPDWARGAMIQKTIGPLVNNLGQQFWYDFYNVIPGVQVFLQGASQAALVLTIEEWYNIHFLNNKNYPIPASSIWINANLLATASPNTEFFGLTVSGGTLQFTNDVVVTNGVMTVPTGTTVTVILQLQQQTDTSVSPDDTGIDAKKAKIQLPPTFSFSFSDAGSQVLAAGDAGWTLYGEPDTFKFNTSQTTTYLPQFNSIFFGYQSSKAEFDALKCKSPFANIRGKAKIIGSAWIMPCAVLDINNPLPASGIGAMVILAAEGLEASWLGLDDVNLKQKEWIKLRDPYISLAPGVINILDYNAGNITARQEYKLYKNAQGHWNTIDLHYTNSFLFFYNCLQAGIESVMAFPNCTGAIDRPVDVAGNPFTLNSEQTFFLLIWSKSLKFVYLIDDNLLIDNANPHQKNITFQPKAIALNNALLTVSPPTGILFVGQLKPHHHNEFIYAIIIETYGLMAFLPILPDPYAADVTIFNRIYQEYNDVYREGIPIQAITQLLVCFMYWKNDEIPHVNFLWGDVTAQQAATSTFALIDSTKLGKVSLDLSANVGLAQKRTEQTAARQEELLMNQYKAAGIIPPEIISTDNQRNDVSQFASRGNPLGEHSLFNLLDVSTNADLLGVDIGFINEQFIFGNNFDVEIAAPAKNSLGILGMDVVASSRFVRIFTVPQISWEPILNTTVPFNPTNDPPFGVLYFDNDGIPALIGNTGLDPVALAPIPASDNLVTNYTNDTFKAWSFFTLANGMVSLGRYNQTNYYLPKPNTDGAKIGLIKASFQNGVTAGLQISTRAGINPNEDNTVFEGLTQQAIGVSALFNPGTWSILGQTVNDIFNAEFGPGPKERGVPLERYDFTGYGAQVFSHWLNSTAEIAKVSQSIFDIWKGRVAKEIIQVRSIIYPWAVRVVRTITMYRSSTGFEYRVDSGWRADSDGVYDFTTKIDPGVNYIFHPGLVRGVYNVKNIVENNLAPYTGTWFKTYGVYVDPNTGLAVPVGGGVNLLVELIPVYFDADVFITDVDGSPAGAGGIPSGKYVPSTQMLGYLQKAPEGVVISPEDFAKILDLQNGLGGPVDCLLNVNASGQKMRVSRVEVNHSLDETNLLVFVAAAKGMPVLPKDGSWSLVSHDLTSKQVVPITGTTVSLIRKGVLGSADDVLNSALPKEITAAAELFKLDTNRLTQYGFLQTTDAQKVLYRNPYFEAGQQLLNSTNPDLGDAYRLLNSTGVFPDIVNLPSIDIATAGCATKIIAEGYQMVDAATNLVPKALTQPFPTNASFTFIDKPGILKVYAEYATTDKNGSVLGAGALNLDLNSQANNWMNQMNNITMVVDLVTMTRIFLIQGQFNTQKGSPPQFNSPKLIPGKDLQPIIDILEVLEQISTDPNYGAIVNKALQIAFSNSPNNWEYKFQADKEIPVLQFPPVYLDGPTTPLRLQANMKLGVYFNMALPIPPTGLPGLSAGGFIEFGATLSVMCVSIAAATVYAVGQVTLRISADTVNGPGLYMKLGFGIELMVGIPVVGDVSLYYAVGIEISLSTSQITVGAFILFRGQASLIGGLVTITIQIEASGKIQKTLAAPNQRTDCIAQVTFSIDVSILFVIDINETESWQEARQIA